jgi:hypothetical protein
MITGRKLKLHITIVFEFMSRAIIDAERIGSPKFPEASVKRRAGRVQEYRKSARIKLFRIWFTRHPELSDTVLGPRSHYNPAALS